MVHAYVTYSRAEILRRACPPLWVLGVAVLCGMLEVAGKTDPNNVWAIMADRVILPIAGWMQHRSWQARRIIGWPGYLLVVSSCGLLFFAEEMGSVIQVWRVGETRSNYGVARYVLLLTLVCLGVSILRDVAEHVARRRRRS